MFISIEKSDQSIYIKIYCTQNLFYGNGEKQPFNVLFYLMQTLFTHTSLYKNKER
jgi:hypothetical protein